MSRTTAWVLVLEGRGVTTRLRQLEEGGWERAREGERGVARVERERGGRGKIGELGGGGRKWGGE